jgi:hypothetical protein
LFLLEAEEAEMEAFLFLEPIVNASFSLLDIWEVIDEVGLYLSPAS